MRSHVQGITLLLLLAVAVWGTARLAAPAVGDVFGDDEAVTVDSAADVVDLAAGTGPAELTEEEIYGIQYLLTLEGYDTRGVDGRLGPATRAAIDQAKEAYGLGVDAHDRALLDYFLDREEVAAEPDTTTVADIDTADPG